MYGDLAPKAVESFVTLATNKGSPTYVGTHIYRAVPGQFLQGGDVEKDNGYGTVSAFGSYFEDDVMGFK